MAPRRRKKRTSSDIRLNLVFVGFLLFFIVILARLFQVQVLNHDRYSALAQEQYWDLSIIPAKRGDILSSDGHVLAGTQTYYLMYAEPQKIENSHKLANDLANLLTDMRFEIDPEDEAPAESKSQMALELFESMYNQLSLDLLWVPLQRQLTPIEKEKVEALEFGGLGFEEEPVRYYPEDTLAAHILGFVASNEGGEKTGYFGIEGSLNEDLKGKPGRVMEETDALGLPILIGGYKKVKPVQGRDVVLTIDRSVQYMVEKKIKEGVEHYGAASGSVIVMNPSTGEVIALANYPAYSPPKYHIEEKPLEEFPHRKNVEKINLAISDVYEPGSVVKPITISAAINLGIVTPETTFEDNGPVWYSGHEIDNWDGKHHNTQTIIQLLQKSNNIGAAWVGHQVGRDSLYAYFKNFGLGSKTNIDLEGEDAGILRDVEEWTDIDLATAAFGQGVSATPLQILNAFNVIANGGYLLEPRVIDKIISSDGEVDIPTKNVRRVISKETSDTMIRLLEMAAEGGEAKYFMIKNYKVAGKTGTAQIPEGGKYSPDRTNATFVGFLSGSREFSMIVKLEEPQESVYAAETAAPLWMDIAKELVKFYGLVPDKG
ncbi:peptidoglycan D,D-transpeptidase FtsI family protein [Patescibacteria group bacterium]